MVRPSIGKPARQKKPKIKVDPKHVAAARELRDKYLERFNSGMILPAGKYAVGRMIEQKAGQSPVTPAGLLEAA